MPTRPWREVAKEICDCDPTEHDKLIELAAELGRALDEQFADPLPILKKNATYN